MAHQRLGSPGGGTVGSIGELPSWWPHGLPPADQVHVLRQAGYYWLAMYGVPATAQGRQTAVYKQNPGDVEAYQDGAPGGMTGPLSFGYSCIWQQVLVRPAPEPKPRAKRTWETLAPSTRSGYRGKMRHVLHLRTEEQFKDYYETAVDLSLLRRHQPKTIVVPDVGRIAFPKGRDVTDYPWLITWQRS